MELTIAAVADSIVSDATVRMTTLVTAIGLYLVEEVITMGEAKRRKKLDPSFGLNKNIECRDADGFVALQVVEFARKKLKESGRGIVILGDRLGYMPLAQFTNQPEVYKLISTYDTTRFILSVTPPKTSVSIELIRGQMEQLSGNRWDANFKH